MTRNERALVAAMAAVMLLTGGTLILRVAGVDLSISLGQANTLAIIGTIISGITITVTLARKLLTFVNGSTDANHGRWREEHKTDVDIDRRLNSLERRADISEAEHQEMHAELRQLANGTRALAEGIAHAVIGSGGQTP